jgi:hypothetical protein
MSYTPDQAPVIKVDEVTENLKLLKLIADYIDRFALTKPEVFRPVLFELAKLIRSGQLDIFEDKSNG